MNDALYQDVFEALPLTAALLDQQGRVVAVNAAWRGFACANGADAESHLGSDYLAICRQASDPAVRELGDSLAALLAGERDRLELEYPCHTPESKHWFSMRATPIPADAGRYALVCHLDVTDRRLAEEEALRQAARDELTGLLRRGSFEERLQQSLNRAARRKETVAVFFVDLDGFKQLNDRHGHAAGDACLQAIGKRMREQLRRADSVARWGGDEIVFFAEDADEAALQSLRDRMHTLFAQPVVFQGQALQVNASIGMALYPDSGPDLDAVLRAADEDMYRHKHHSRSAR